MNTNPLRSFFPFWPAARRILILSLTVLFVQALQPTPALGWQVTGGPGLNEKTGSANRFRNLVVQIQKNENSISQLFTSMPIGFVKEQQEIMRQIAALKMENEKLRGQLDQAALESFAAAPQENQDAVRHIYELMSNKLAGKALGQQLYDPEGALKIADLMMTSGYEATPILYQAFRACYAIQDFSRAESLAERLRTEGQKLNPDFLDQLADAKSKWERETEIRAQETAADDLPRVKFVTSEGEFTIELFENQAPQTVANFVSLVESKFYDGLTFHLVQPPQFAQTGCPIGDGKGNPGYRIANELDPTNSRNFFAGTIGMANEGPDTAGSQFFIAYQANGFYDKDFVAFGRVMEGLNVVYSLKPADKTADTPVPDEPSRIVSASVVRKRDHAYEPVKVANPDPSAAVPAIDSNPADSTSQIPDVAPGN